VTDRRRLGTDATRAGLRRCLLQQVRHAVDAGVDVLQVRERDLEAAELAALVSAVLAVAEGSSCRVVVNDRLDVALACGAAGVHLRGDSLPPSAVRAVAPAGFLVGRSVRDAGEALAAAPHVDYLIAGTIFPSASKPSADALLGTAGLAAIARAVPVPVLAIGGVTAGRVGEIAAAGAAGVAAIGLFMGAPGLECRAVPLRELVAGLRDRFDTSRTRT
jgi:thiamine-phosphate diphosphorylase